MKQVLLFPSQEQTFYKFDPLCFCLPKEGLFRGPETQVAHPEEKRDGEIRIICVGDSTTYGLAVGYYDSWPYLLERLLKNKFPHKNIKVLNAGFPGVSEREVKRIFQIHLVKYNPDIVIFRDDFTGLTDSYEVPEVSYVLRYCLGWCLYKSKILRVIGIMVKSHPPANRAANFIMHKLSGVNYEKNKFDSDFNNLKKIASEQGIKYVVAVDVLRIHPKEGDIRSNYFDYVRKGSGPVVCTYNAFKEKLKSVPVNELFVDQEHLTEIGTSMVAREIFKFLVAEKWIKSI